MKVRLEKYLVLILTAESYVEEIALCKWAEKYEGKADLLIEPFEESKKLTHEIGHTHPIDERLLNLLTSIIENR